jgi:hypothetical protein
LRHHVPERPDPKWVDGQQARMNGVRAGDPSPKPAPTDAGYEPAPGEEKETFKCEGGVFHGYKRGCVDFKEMPSSSRWAEKISSFFVSRREAARRFFVHHLFHDGKNPECTSNCNHLVNAGATCLWGGLMAICYAATDGACGAALPAIGAGSADLFITSEYSDWMKGICANDICTVR